MSDKRTKRSFTQKQKLTILAEARDNGVQATLDKHALYAATYYSWKAKFDELGDQGLKHGMTKAQSKRITELEGENRHLKELLGQKELETKLKDELLKKKYPKLYARTS